MTGHYGRPPTETVGDRSAGDTDGAEVEDEVWEMADTARTARTTKLLKAIALSVGTTVSEALGTLSRSV